MDRLLTSESVTEGHPDKVADQISDAILDAILREDPDARVACETFITTGLVLIAGEVSTTATVDLQGIARQTLRTIGYTGGPSGFNADTCSVMIALDKQSKDIAQGVDEDENGELGAGDQGMMFGFATDETDERMPLPITLAHRLTRRLSHVRKEGIVPYLLPDGKAQVTVTYDDEGTPTGVDTVVVSTHHLESYEGAPLVHAKNELDGRVREDVIEHVIRPVLKEAGYWRDEITVYVNPTGAFVVGGPVADAGLTGRKVIVDTYGGAARHGGGAFSGKDATKVDRSAAYAARWIAKSLVDAGLARRCELQLAYAIGVAQPVSIMLRTFGTSTHDHATLTKAIREVFNLTPAGIIKALDLTTPRFKRIAAYGHFGRSDMPWEDTTVTAPALAEAVERIASSDGCCTAQATV